MRGIVLIDHGSREPAANAQLDTLAEQVAARLPDCAVRAAHMELAAPSLDEAVDTLVAEGATEITLHPFFVAPGRHVREDIPRLAADARARHPTVPIHITAPLGLHPAILEAVLSRLSQ